MAYFISEKLLQQNNTYRFISKYTEVNKIHQTYVLTQNKKCNIYCGSLEGLTLPKTLFYLRGPQYFT